MRILIYGAGVLGSNLAHDFYKAGKDVTLLARNQWYETIKNNGLMIRHKLRFHTSCDKIKVIDHLDKDDFYDAIFVVMQNTQIDNVVPVLTDNVSKTIIFTGNNTDPRTLSERMADKHVLFAFYTAAGQRKDGMVESISLRKITIGRLDNSSEDNAFIQKVFSNTKVKVDIDNQMDDWLKSHLAFVLPVIIACYYTSLNLRNVKNDKAYIHEIVKAVKDCYDILTKLGYQVPKEDYDFVTSKGRYCYWFFKLCCSTSVGDIVAADHARNAPGEMKYFITWFMELKQKAAIETPSLDRVYELGKDKLPK